MDFLAEYGLFFLQTMTVVVAVILVIAVSSKLSGGDEAKGTIKVTDLSKKIADQKKYVSAIVETALNNDQPSFLERLKNRLKKTSPKKSTAESAGQKKLAVVLEFKGDMKASQVNGLREEVSAILFNGSDPSSCGPEINLARRIGSHLWFSELPACAFARCRC